MGTVLIIIAIVAVHVLMIGGFIIAFKSNNRLRNNVKAIEKKLEQEGFVTTKKVGELVGRGVNSSCFLYVDEINKKWLLTSPHAPIIGKIRDFDDLLDYGCYDEDGIDVAAKLANAAISLGAAGIALSGITFGLVGFIATTIFASKIPRIKADGESRAHGIMVITTDCDETIPYLVFDFLAVIRMNWMSSKSGFDRAIARFFQSFGDKLKQGVPRRGLESKLYKDNMVAIEKMCALLEQIMNSNPAAQKGRDNGGVSRIFTT